MHYISWNARAKYHDSLNLKQGFPKGIITMIPARSLWSHYTQMKCARANPSAFRQFTLVSRVHPRRTRPWVAVNGQRRIGQRFFFTDGTWKVELWTYLCRGQKKVMKIRSRPFKHPQHWCFTAYVRSTLTIFGEKTMRDFQSAILDRCQRRDVRRKKPARCTWDLTKTWWSLPSKNGGLKKKQRKDTVNLEIGICM